MKRSKAPRPLEFIQRIVDWAIGATHLAIISVALILATQAYRVLTRPPAMITESDMEQIMSRSHNPIKSDYETPQTVYVTSCSKRVRYHLNPDCEHIRKSGISPIPVPLGYADRRKLKPCKLCSTKSR